MRKPPSRPRPLPARLLPFRSPPAARGRPAPRPAKPDRHDPGRPAPPRRLTSLAGFFRPRAQEEVAKTLDDR